MVLRKRTPRERVSSLVNRSTTRSGTFPVDIVDRGEELLVEIEVPGVRKQDLDVSVRKDKLQVAVDYGDDESVTYLRRERDRGEKRQVIRLPAPVDEDRVSASYNDGILRVTLRRRGQSKHIQVQ